MARAFDHVLAGLPVRQNRLVQPADVGDQVAAALLGFVVDRDLFHGVLSQGDFLGRPFAVRPDVHALGGEFHRLSWMHPLTLTRTVTYT